MFRYLPKIQKKKEFDKVLLCGFIVLLSSVEEFLVQEGPVLLEMRVKQLTKERQPAKATLLAKTCSQSPAMQGQGPFRQMYLVCLCATSDKEELMEEVSAATPF